MKFKNFNELIDLVKGKTNRVVVPGANNKEALTAIKMADDKGLITKGILIGPTAEVKNLMKEIGLKEDKFEFVECTDVPTMCNIAAKKSMTAKATSLLKV